MKVLVSKINPKEIEEKIAKAESVTQTNLLPYVLKHVFILRVGWVLLL